MIARPARFPLGPAPRAGSGLARPAAVPAANPPWPEPSGPRRRPASRIPASPGIGRVLALLLATGTPAPAEEACLAAPPAAAPETVTVVAVPAGDEVRLADGRALRLAGVRVPGGPERGAADPDAEAARRALAALVAGQSLNAIALAAPDRHGHVRGTLVIPETGLWVTRSLVAAGHLRVTPNRDERACIRALLAEEAAARSARRGLWADPKNAVLAATDTELPSKADSYAIVEGTVVSTGRAGSRHYIDFGRDHRADFTVVIEDRSRGLFEKAGFRFEALKGRRIRVRGWLAAHNGGEIGLDVPEGMEWAE